LCIGPGFIRAGLGWLSILLFLAKSLTDIAYPCHKLVSVNQLYQQPCSFWFKYISERRRVGYWNNPYEKAAYAVQHKAEGALRREDYRMQIKSKAS